MDDPLFEKVGDRYQLSFERTLAHPPERVWRVLTERDLLAQWFPCDVQGEWTVGADLRFTFPDGEEVPEEDCVGRVLAVEPNRLLEFEWGTRVIRCELAPEGEGCKLSFRETLDAPSEGARNGAGWSMCIENLELVVSSGTLLKFAWDVWKARFEKYKKKFEPQHGPQKGPPNVPPES